MKPIQATKLAGLAITVIGGVFYLGHLDGKIKGLDPNAIRKAQEKALEQIDIQKSYVLPSGSVLISTKLNPTPPPGWVRCGDEGTPNLDGLYLIGTRFGDSVGTEVGSRHHSHKVDLVARAESRTWRSRREGVDNETGDPNHNHEHPVKGETVEALHLPPSLRVMFFCKP